MSGKAVLLDSSVWLEILSSGKLLSLCESERKKAQTVVVPMLVLYEVYKKVTIRSSEDQGLQAVAMLAQNEIHDVTREIALTAADLSLEFDLGMVDSMIFAHARLSDAKFITLDNNFAKIPNVKVLR